jgi:hypothetical protein
MSVPNPPGAINKVANIGDDVLESDNIVLVSYPYQQFGVDAGAPVVNTSLTKDNTTVGNYLALKNIPGSGGWLKVEELPIDGQVDIGFQFSFKKCGAKLSLYGSSSHPTAGWEGLPTGDMFDSSNRTALKYGDTTPYFLISSSNNSITTSSYNGNWVPDGTILTMSAGADGANMRGGWVANDDGSSGEVDVCTNKGSWQNLKIVSVRLYSDWENNIPSGSDITKVGPDFPDSQFKIWNGATTNQTGNVKYGDIIMINQAWEWIGGDGNAYLSTKGGNVGADIGSNTGPNSVQIWGSMHWVIVPVGTNGKAGFACASDTAANKGVYGIWPQHSKYPTADCTWFKCDPRTPQADFAYNKGAEKANTVVNTQPNPLGAGYTNDPNEYNKSCRYHYCDNSNKNESRYPLNYWSEIPSGHGSFLDDGPAGAWSVGDSSAGKAFDTSIQDDYNKYCIYQECSDPNAYNTLPNIKTGSGGKRPSGGVTHGPASCKYWTCDSDPEKANNYQKTSSSNSSVYNTECQYWTCDSTDSSNYHKTSSPNSSDYNKECQYCLDPVATNTKSPIPSNAVQSSPSSCEYQPLKPLFSPGTAGSPGQQNIPIKTNTPYVIWSLKLASQKQNYLGTNIYGDYNDQPKTIYAIPSTDNPLPSGKSGQEQNFQIELTRAATGNFGPCITRNSPNEKEIIYYGDYVRIRLIYKDKNYILRAAGAGGLTNATLVWEGAGGIEGSDQCDQIGWTTFQVLNIPKGLYQNNPVYLNDSIMLRHMADNWDSGETFEYYYLNLSPNDNWIGLQQHNTFNIKKNFPKNPQDQSKYIGGGQSASDQCNVSSCEVGMSGLTECGNKNAQGCNPTCCWKQGDVPCDQQGYTKIGVANAHNLQQTICSLEDAYKN